MPKEHEKIKYLPAEKSLKVLFIVYADLECLLKKYNLVNITPKILTQRKKLSTNLQDTHGFQYAHLMMQKTDAIFIGERTIENFCKDLKELGMEIINFEEKEMIPLTNKEIKSYEKQKVCHICKEKLCSNKNKKKVRDHCHFTGKFRGATHSKCNLRYKVPKEIPVVFHNGSTYDYHFIIIKKLAEEFKGEFKCLGENKEKYVPCEIQRNQSNLLTFKN